MSATVVESAFRRRWPLSPAETIVLGLLLAITLVALFGGYMTPYDPLLRSGPRFQPPSVAHWLGTDEIGRDLLSRIIAGVRLTWLPALGIIAMGILVGSVVGLVSGAAGGRVDFLLQRITELFQVLPSTIIALAVIAALGPGILNTMIAIGIFWWPWYARLVRAEIRHSAAMPHAEAARLAGVGRIRFLVRYLLPSAVPVVLVTATLDIANVILVLSTFSFLGLGAPAPAPELGAMTAHTLANIVDFWWLPLLPAAVTFLLVLVANYAGDVLRRRFEHT
jgi:peptide/nickel transport system permease protein